MSYFMFQIHLLLKLDEFKIAIVRKEQKQCQALPVLLAKNFYKNSFRVTKYPLNIKIYAEKSVLPYVRNIHYILIRVVYENYHLYCKEFFFYIFCGKCFYTF